MIYPQEELRGFKEYFKNSTKENKEYALDSTCKTYSIAYDTSVSEVYDEYTGEQLGNELLALKLEAKKSVKIIIEEARAVDISEEFINKTLKKYELDVVLK